MKYSRKTPAEQVGQNVPREARLILEELNNQLGKIYADITVPRDKVRAVVDQGRVLADQTEIWTQKEGEREEFLEILKQLDRKINQTPGSKSLESRRSRQGRQVFDPAAQG